MNYLALDIGERRTGVAFADDASKIPVSLDTIHHHSVDELITEVMIIIEKKKIDHVIVGLPKLLSGEEGSQSSFVRDVAMHLEKTSHLPLSFVDERYSTPQPKGGKSSISPGSYDGDAAAAIALMGVFLRV